MSRVTDRASHDTGLMPRFYLLLAVTTISTTVTATSATGEILFESGMLGPIGLTFDDFGGMPEPSGSFVSDFAFTGVRFELTRPAVTTGVGGHFVIDPGQDDSFFGAIVRLDSSSDFPDSGSLSTSDVEGQTLLSFPDTSAEVFGDLELSLTPGWYALVFGSGLFSATGRGAALTNNPDIGSPSYIGHQAGPSWFEFSTIPGPFKNFRLVVVGRVIPEPSALFLAVLAIALLLLMRNRINNLRKARGRMSCAQRTFALQISGGFNGTPSANTLDFIRRNNWSATSMAKES